MPQFSYFVVFQQLEIDYIIGENNRELLPSSIGPAAILRIFGVTKEGNIFIWILPHPNQSFQESGIE